MFDRARSALESFKSQWKSGEHQDDFELSMFAAAQEEYESGAGHKGLLAKVSAETGFDDNQTKASYMKARTAQLMGKKEAILGAMLKIQKLNVEIEEIKCSVSLLNDARTPSQSEPSPEMVAEVVYAIDRTHKSRVEYDKQDNTTNQVTLALISFMFCTFAGLFLTISDFATLTPATAAPLLILGALGAWYTVNTADKSNKKQINQELIRYQAEIADTAEITRVALKKLDAEGQAKLISLERTEQTLKNLIATRESTASTLEGLFG
jgi:hypothetical protein